VSEAPARALMPASRSGRRACSTPRLRRPADSLSLPILSSRRTSPPEESHDPSRHNGDCVPNWYLDARGRVTNMDLLMHWQSFWLSPDTRNSNTGLIQGARERPRRYTYYNVACGEALCNGSPSPLRRLVH
jgi:hypothetical protein